MRISFIIITDGKKRGKIQNQLASISKNFQATDADICEVIISGETKSLQNELDLLDLKVLFNQDSEAAFTGNLSKMRNGAAEKASLDFLVVSDDDIVFSESWLEELKKSKNFSILTPRVISPDGTRFWDHACFLSPTKGHMILNPNEEDDYIYMSGGTGWIMKKEVWNSIKWDESFTIYQEKGKSKHNEDTDFSKKCREKYKISHNPKLVVFHDDPVYTSVGRACLRRRFSEDKNWCRELRRLPDQVLAKFSIDLFNWGLYPEAADIVRTFYDNNANCQKVLFDIEEKLGGKLEGSEFKKYE